MKVFIIGGAGYIGSHIVKRANGFGHEVITIDNLSTGHKDAVLHGHFELCDILDTKKISKLFVKHKPEAVIHCGSFSIVNESLKDPYKYYANNVSGTLSLLKAMIDNDCKKIIFSSSAAIFGNPEYTPIDENHLKNPINPYGRSKLMIEKILKDFELAYDLKYISFRYFNAAGHDPESNLKERHKPETHLIPIVMNAFNGKGDSVDIYGNDYDTKDGTAIRDYIHVNDLAEAHLKGLNYLTEKNTKSTEFNLGNGNGYSVKDVIKTISNLMQKDIRLKVKDRRPGDPKILVASNSKAKKELGFEPKYIKLEDIIKTIK